jgi:hypothetical protein
MNNGWIKLHRKLLESQIYRNLNSKQRDIFIVCLLLANHQQNEWMWGSKIYKCEPGEFITSLKNLAQKCGKDVKVQSVRTSLLKLEEWHFLTNISTKTGRLIKILNWAKYQSIDEETNKDTNRQLTKSQQRANKELTTNKNDKNDKNDKNVKNRVIGYKSPTPSQIMKEFINNKEKQNLLIEVLIGKGIDKDVITFELKKFISYWTELSKSGKKQRWELERTFEIQRRLTTWFNNLDKFKDNKIKFVK